MSKFKRVGIRGFRRLLDVDLELRPLTVMIGANGVGKSSILDVFSLLSASAGSKLNEKLNELGGIGSVLTYGKSNSLFLSLDMKVPGYEPLVYELTIAPKGASYSITSETLSQRKRPHDSSAFFHISSSFDDVKYYEVDEKRLVRPTWEHNPLETSLSQVPKMFKQPEDLRQTLSSTTLYHVLNVEPRDPVRLPQQMRPAELPGKDGEDLAPLLYYLRESDKDRFESIEDTLRSAFSGFESLNFPPVAAGVLAMTWKDKNFDKPLYMNQLSEGMLRFLWLTALLQSPGLTALTMIDEPEVSLHPELLSLLADLLREASTRTNILVATHSDRLVRFLNPSEVVVMDINDDGLATALWADTFDLEEWLKEYSLDEIWRKGRIGGRS